MPNIFQLEDVNNKDVSSLKTKEMLFHGYSSGIKMEWYNVDVGAKAIFR